CAREETITTVVVITTGHFDRW
nr:immunoglobulin heavy chain junction region [Macaca mulatta]